MSRLISDFSLSRSSHAGITDNPRSNSFNAREAKPCFQKDFASMNQPFMKFGLIRVTRVASSWQCPQSSIAAWHNARLLSNL